MGCKYFVCNYIKTTSYKILALLLFKYLLISLQMRRHLQKVMPEHRVIWDFTKTEHGRLREVDHESRKKKFKKNREILSNRFFLNQLVLTENQIY